MRVRCGKDGKVLLYGTACARCDCAGATLELDGVVSMKQAERMAWRDRGFDRGDDLGDAFAYMVAADIARARDEAFAKAMYGGNPYDRAGVTDPPYHFDCRSSARPYPAVEIISDPADRRGFDARPVRAR